MQIFLKAIQICLPFIEVKDMAAKVVGKNLGSHCPVSCLCLSGFPRLMQNVSKILVAASNSCKLSAALRSDRQGRERRGVRQGMFVGAAIVQKERGGRLDAPTCSLLQIPAFRQSLLLCLLVLRQLHPAAGNCSQKEQKRRCTNKLPSCKASLFPVITCLM